MSTNGTFSFILSVIYVKSAKELLNAKRNAVMKPTALAPIVITTKEYKSIKKATSERMLGKLKANLSAFLKTPDSLLKTET
jgi:hypothetical protein